MTEKYFISISPRISGCHTIHKQTCPFLPDPGKRIPLGVFQSSQEAVLEGREFFKIAEKCPFCLKEPAEKKRWTFTVIQANPDLISTARMKKATWESLMFFAIS